jgi:hypothetical protein
LGGLQHNVIADGEGGAFVGWVDDRNGEPDIRMRRLTQTGEAAVGWPLEGLLVCRAPYSQYQLATVGDGGGGVFLAWQDYRAGRVGQVFVQHLSQLGEVVSGWPAEGRAVTDTLVEQSAPQLATDGAGGAYVVWQGRRRGSLGVYTQRLTAAAETAPGWPRNGAAIPEGSGEQRSPSICADSLGRALLVWQEVDALGGLRLAALRLDSNVQPETGWNPTVLTLAEGAADFSEQALVQSGAGVLVVWGERRGGSSGIRLQRVDLEPPSVAWTLGGMVVSESPVDLSRPMVLADGHGGYVAWTDLRSEGQSDIFVQRFAGTGSVGTGWPANGVPVAAGPGNEYAPWLASDGTGGVLVTWSDPTMSASAGYVSLAKFLQRGLPQLIEAVARPSQVRLVWRLASAVRESLEVERRFESDDWRSLGRAACDASGRVVVVDRGAPQGTRVEYRLGVALEDARMFFEPVGIDIPHAPLVLTLHRARIDASRNALALAFALPAGEAPVVELIDVTGRRVARQSLTGLDPGEHETSVPLPGRVPAGVYFLRLMQSGQLRTAKLALLR